MRTVSKEQQTSLDNEGELWGWLAEGLEAAMEKPEPGFIER